MTLESFRGRPVLLIFYLGHSCKHCVEQLNAFAPEVKRFEEVGISMVAIAPEEGLELAKAHSLCESEPAHFPFPLLADPEMEVFRRYGAYDDFEGMGLHGTFLISPGGKVI